MSTMFFRLSGGATRILIETESREIRCVVYRASKEIQKIGGDGGIAILV